MYHELITLLFLICLQNQGQVPDHMNLLHADYANQHVRPLSDLAATLLMWTLPVAPTNEMELESSAGSNYASARATSVRLESLDLTPSEPYREDMNTDHMLMIFSRIYPQVAYF